MASDEKANVPMNRPATRGATDGGHKRIETGEMAAQAQQRPGRARLAPSVRDVGQVAEQDDALQIEAISGDGEVADAAVAAGQDRGHPDWICPSWGSTCQESPPTHHRDQPFTTGASGRSVCTQSDLILSGADGWVRGPSAAARAQAPAAADRASGRASIVVPRSSGREARRSVPCRCERDLKGSFWKWATGMYQTDGHGRTTSRRDGQPRHCDAQRENEHDERDAQVGRQAGDDGAVPSRVEIQCECAFTYMNAVIRKNLTDALAADANDVDTASDTKRRIRQWQGQSAVLPDDSDTPRMPGSCADSPRSLRHGRQKAPPGSGQRSRTRHSARRTMASVFSAMEVSGR